MVTLPITDASELILTMACMPYGRGMKRVSAAMRS